MDHAEYSNDALALLAATGWAEAAGVQRENLPGVALGAHLNARDPFDPFEAAPAGRDEAYWRAVVVRQRRAADVGRQQRRGRLGHRQAPAVAGHRHKADPARRLEHAGALEQALNGRSLPYLGAVETAGAVERCLELVLLDKQIGVAQR